MTGKPALSGCIPSSTARQGSPSLACGYKEPGRRANRERTARDFQLWTEDSYYNMAYTVWYSEQNPYNLDMQKIQYILARFP